ncbi:IS1634 family transposase [Muricomes intestini]|jgi:transposase|uniref:DDE family transposase n=1 Tax=Muricomes intestini TaxID=1796634 RepID=A0A4R3JUU4_9FIRM|nr:IS1634 family transposase [Muricomes intestini]TCS71588.1 DDE family transposase [Muricomes intestini]
MFLKTITKKGVTRLYFYESYYEPSKVKGEKGRIRQRSLKSLGSLDELKKLYDDPIAHFTEIAKQRSKAQKDASQASISIDLSSVMTESEDCIKNVGYGILKEIYKQLELDIFWKNKAKKRNMQFDPDSIFRLLVISRVLFPGSKKQTYENRNIYFERIEGFALDDVYHALSFIEENQEDMQKWIFEHSVKICGRDLSTTYFDCTNYYFDIGHSDLDTLGDDGNPVDRNGNKTAPKYRKRGPEKNHRPDPIVEMGLLMDKNGIPLAYDLFPGNESEKVHMRPIVNRLKDEFTDMRVIFVADRGLNTSDNIYYLNGDNKCDNNQRDGYVYGQSVRGADEEFKKWVLGRGYHTDNLKDDEGNEIKFIHKSRIYPKKLNVNVTSADGKHKKKKTVSVDQKQMAYYSEKYAKKQRRDREIMVERAKDLIRNPRKYDRVTSAGSAAYVQNISFDRTTGEIMDGKELSLNLPKIEEESKYDGYYSIVTSELNMKDYEMRETYHGLGRIEETFKISKSDFDSRPVFVRTNEHIDGHFATCFTALVLIRILQAKLQNKYPVGKMLQALRKYSCIRIDANTYQFVYFDEVLKSCEEAFGLKLDSKYRNRLQIRRMLKY